MDEHPANTTIFHLSRGGCSATGELTGDGFLVHAGAVGNTHTAPSFAGTAAEAVRKELLSAGRLRLDEDRIILETDHEFSSPSGAASVLLGHRASGYNRWLTDDGRELGTILRPAGESMETTFRRRWFQAHVDRFVSDSEVFETVASRFAGYRASTEEGLGFLAELRRTRDLDAFHEALKPWAMHRPYGFGSPSGLMFFTQLLKNSQDPDVLTDVLIECLAAPADDDEARAKLERITAHVEEIRVGNHPAPGHAPFLLSYFWAFADPERWPVAWASTVAYLETSTGQPLPDLPVERYMQYLELAREVTDDLVELETTAAWWNETRPVFLDPVLADRCAFGRDDAGNPEYELWTNARALVGISTYFGNTLAETVAEAVGRELVPRKPLLEWAKGRARADLWADWWTVDANGLGIRLWVDQGGAAIALRPGLQRKGWYQQAGELVKKHDIPGMRFLGGPRSAQLGDDVGLQGRSGEFVYGRWFTPDEFEGLDLRHEVEATAAALQAPLDELHAVATGTQLIDAQEEDELTPLVLEFKHARGYPTAADEADQADRERFAEMLAADTIGLVDVSDLRQIWSTSRYGNAGTTSDLNRAFRNADAAEHDRMLSSLSYLCWGHAPDAERIDSLLSDDQHRIAGLSESVVMKLLAICHPDRYLAVFPSSGPKGKRRALQKLGIAEPSGSRGEVQVAANQALYERLAPLFPGDAWGMTLFLYWYLEREDEDADEQVTFEEKLDKLAEELLVPRSFLEDIVALIEDKGQVIFYGPPGTGKTYLARKLAEVLVSDPTRRSLVQFHPSSSYEDFFEGYRPESGDDGEMTYRLTPGPLALLAERAADAPGKRHLMIIDEINRANLPKVFGELLFLLEYRNEQVRTLYRPEDAFQLPRDLWFIGTMNTADRSIALVDAALRRRFHFIPFFPNDGAMKGLLDRWLAAEHEPAWVGELVAHVNDELERELGGPHLLIGPSHFMKKGLDVDAMRRIWAYNIEPFIEDQFFGDRDKIKSFRFDEVYRRYRERAGLDEIEALDAEAAEIEAATDDEALAVPAVEATVGVPAAAPTDVPAAVDGEGDADLDEIPEPA
ncbi:MAG: DUF4357 domain-containing protein [Acidimicrobiales bacterium]